MPVPTGGWRWRRWRAVLGMALIGLATPWPLKILIDSALGEEPLPQVLERMLGPLATNRVGLIGVVVAAELAIGFLLQGFGVVGSYVNTKLDLSMTLDFRTVMFRHTQRLSLAFHDRRKSGMALYRINYQGFPIRLPQMAPLYTREPPSARNPVRRTIVQLQRPSPQPTLTWNRPEPLLSGHFSDTAPHLYPFFASLRCTRPRVSLPAPAAPRSSAASRRRAAGSDDLPPAGASSIWRASPAGPQFSPAAAGDSSATSA